MAMARDKIQCQMETVTTIARLTLDAITFGWLILRRDQALAAENLFLRKQLAFYQERGTRPRRLDAPTRVALVLLSKLCDWRDALVIVQPATLVRWHRRGFRLFGVGSRARVDRAYQRS